MRSANILESGYTGPNFAGSWQTLSNPIVYTSNSTSDATYTSGLSISSVLNE